MRDHQKGIWQEPVRHIPSSIGVSLSWVKRNTFPLDGIELTHSKFIEHLRDALSHPTFPEKRPLHPSTGYTTVPDKTGTISRFRFINSPWVDRGEIKSHYCGNNEELLRQEADRFCSKHQCGELEVRQNSKGKYQIFLGDKPYLPVFEAELSIEDLKSFAAELANYLAQPTREDWDGRSVVHLVA